LIRRLTSYHTNIKGVDQVEYVIPSGRSECLLRFCTTTKMSFQTQRPSYRSDGSTRMGTGIKVCFIRAIVPTKSCHQPGLIDVDCQGWLHPVVFALSDLVNRVYAFCLKKYVFRLGAGIEVAVIPSYSGEVPTCGLSHRHVNTCYYSWDCLVQQRHHGICKINERKHMFQRSGKPVPK
jgi:hypothetical protein